MKSYKKLFVAGTGFSALSAVIALLDRRYEFEEVVFFEKRNHPGGNVWDFDSGKIYHRYGPHIFHTNAPGIINFVKRFAFFQSISHYAYAVSPEGDISYIPSSLFWVRLSGKTEINLPDDIMNRKLTVAQLPEDIYEIVYNKWYLPYSKKVWGKYWTDEMIKTVASRVPFYTDFHRVHCYFDDRMIALPVGGYWRMVHRMIDYIRSKVNLVRIVYGEDALNRLEDIAGHPFIYTGALDALYEKITGEKVFLPYIYLKIAAHDSIETITTNEKVLTYLKNWINTSAAAVFHLSNEEDMFTRVVAYDRFGLDRKFTVEYPCDEPREGYFKAYPINQREFREKASAMQKELSQRGVVLLGRLATYQYYNMDQVIGQALAFVEKTSELPVFKG